ncbi:hypothetical protein DP144_01790 [Clostridium tetani]|nr:hypothetical protein DP154_01785 [Clostridium tetani]RYV00378.1 hypothetical protein DP144_01790 [Clostridium tetani]
MLFNLNPGHTLSGGDIGTRGINGLKEEVLTRQLVVELDKELRNRGHRTNICRVDYASTLNESLNKQVSLCNAVNADLNICIHFNTTIGGYGSEIFTYGGKYLIEADRVLKQLNNLGFRNRGIKDQPLALTKRTKAKTIYIEVCFIDNPNDIKILNKYGMSGIAKAIVNGVLHENKKISNTNNPFIKLDGGGTIVGSNLAINLIIKDYKEVDRVFGHIEGINNALWAFDINPPNINYAKLKKNANQVAVYKGLKPNTEYKILASGYKDGKKVTETSIVLKTLEQQKKIEEKLYRVQTGAFANKKYAEDLRDELKSKGYEGFITE